jgi:polar amino acid transport system substrate-binding protein
MVLLLILGTERGPAEGQPWPGILGKIKERGSVIVWQEAEYKPYEFQDASGKQVGLDVDLARAIFEEGPLKVRVEITTAQFAGLLPALAAGKADILISAIAGTKDRARQFGIGDPYSVAGSAIVANSKQTEIKSAQDLSGKRVGSLAGGATSTAAQENEKELKAKGLPGYAEWRQFPTYPPAYQDLALGRIDALIGSTAGLRVLVKERPGDFRFVGFVGPVQYHGVVVRLDTPELLEYCNQQLRRLKADGTLKAIHERWLGHSDVAVLPDTWVPVQ